MQNRILLVLLISTLTVITESTFLPSSLSKTRAMAAKATVSLDEGFSRQYFLRFVQIAPLKSTKKFFTGTWEGYFPCGPNLYVLKYTVSGNNLIQTVISHGGENCLPNGHVSTVAQIPDSVSFGSIFPAIIYLGTGSQIISTTIEIIDDNTLKYGRTNNYEGTILRRRSSVTDTPLGERRK